MQSVETPLHFSFFGMNFEETFDEAKYIKFSQRSGLIYVWHGGHTVNLYMQEGTSFKPVDVFSFGDFSKNTVSLEEAEHKIKERIQEEEEELRL